MHVAVSSAGVAVAPAHVLRKYPRRGHAPDQKCCHIAMGWTYDILRPSEGAGPDADGFLPAADIHAAHNFPLAVQLSFDSILQLARQHHVVEHSPQRFRAYGVDEGALQGHADALPSLRQFLLAHGRNLRGRMKIFVMLSHDTHHLRLLPTATGPVRQAL